MDFRILGPMTVLDVGVSLNVGGPKQRTVLAMLIAHRGRPLTAESIAQAVYGPDTADSSRRLVQTYVSTLRSVVGKVIVKEGSAWTLETDRADIDANRFADLYEASRTLDPQSASEVLREALDLWRGQPYADIESHGVLDAEITRLVELRTSVQHAWISADLDTGRAADLIGDIEALLAEHPYQEQFRAQHMVALYRAGRQSEALRSYQRIRGLLVNDLGVEPTPELQNLEMRILDQDDSLLLPSPPPRLEQPADSTGTEIRFATTDDGVGIAYWARGSGPPLILIQNLTFNHLEAEWAVPSMASLYQALADRYRLIRLNPRGFGLSENPFPRFGITSTGAQAGMTTSDMGLDISAVAAACELDQFMLMACATMGPVAIEYAANHTDQISGLILCDAVAAIQNSYMAEVTRIGDSMRELSDELKTEMAFSSDDWFPKEEILQSAELGKMAWRQIPPTQRYTSNATLEWDATSRMADIVAPTIIVTGRSLEWERTTPDSQKLAAGIPGAQLRLIDGIMTPYNAVQAAMLEAIDAIHRQASAAQKA